MEDNAIPLPSEFAPGDLLSDAILRAWLRHCGKHVKVYKGSRLVPPDRISISDHTQIDEGVTIFAGDGVEIGRYVHLAFNSSISGGGSCRVQDFAGIGAGSRIITGTELIDGGLTNPTVPPEFRVVSRGNVDIQAHALVFTSCVVLPDVTIGEGAIVAAGSVVHRSLKPWAIYAGRPLVQVGIRERGPVLEKASRLLAAPLA